jgi:transcriptional regulator of arginine metabolism
MKAKDERLKDIEQIVRTEIITCQEELHAAMLNRGFKISQATLSRDLKRLKVVKVHDEMNRYVYVLPDMAKPKTTKLQPEIEIRSTLEFSGKLAVLKTRQGYASGIASEIDKNVTDEILATIAGDDTILIIPRKGYSKAKIVKALSKYTGML